MCFGAYYQKTFVPIFTPLIVFTTNYSFSELRLSAQDNHVGHLKCGENTMYEVCVLKKTDLHCRIPTQGSQVVLSPLRPVGSARLDFFSFPLSFLRDPFYLFLSFIYPSPPILTPHTLSGFRKMGALFQ